ncbi:helix-turn-helix domain-containing protein [Caloranaerobacter ferrireducens]|uniref:helix-turn-helix domain-containing protein n=1 Tax=Caloranaerobacter ferrireducens TaxID=1323370 RepID=UPI00084E05C7|nr:helix-turn-helix transcriptional regulator [Caloranaerobacter ferrireducens]
MSISYILANRIKELRTERNITQEEMAKVLGTSRQRYSRLENGQTSISYVVIKKIAEYFNIPTSEITKVTEEKKDLVSLFREKSDKTKAVKAVEKIEEILKVFSAHEKLYYQMKKGDCI